MCIYTKKLKNRRYTKNKKNGGKVPPLPDLRIEYVPTKCGKCIECRKQYARGWTIRLLEEIKTNTNGKFTVLTFSDQSIKKLMNQLIKKKIGENTIYNIKTREPKIIPTYQLYYIHELKGYERDNAIATKGIRLFTERWRKLKSKPPRHWFVTELGHNGTENIHLHGIIWTNETYKFIRTTWQYGWIWPRPDEEKFAYVNIESICYNMKYVSKQDLLHKEYIPIILASKKIGYNYVNTRNAQNNQFKNRDTDETYRTTTGHKIILPTYLRKQLYTEWELEQLWLNSLDKETAYVLGKKIDLKKGDTEYKKAIQDAKRINAELGYGQGKNDNRKEHEENRREQMIQTRIMRTNKNEPGKH